MNEETTEGDATPEGVRRNPGPPGPMLLAEVLLRVLERLSAKDNDQEFLELYNSLKPAVEPILRRGPRGTMKKALGNGFQK